MIVVDVQGGKKVLVVAHGNSLRALVKHLSNLSDSEIMDFNIPTGNLFRLHYCMGERTVDLSQESVNFITLSNLLV